MFRKICEGIAAIIGAVCFILILIYATGFFIVTSLFFVFLLCLVEFIMWLEK